MKFCPTESLRGSSKRKSCSTQGPGAAPQVASAFWEAVRSAGRGLSDPLQGPAIAHGMRTLAVEGFEPLGPGRAYVAPDHGGRSAGFCSAGVRAQAAACAPRPSPVNPTGCAAGAGTGLDQGLKLRGARVADAGLAAAPGPGRRGQAWCLSGWPATSGRCTGSRCRPRPRLKGRRAPYRPRSSAG